MGQSLMNQVMDYLNNLIELDKNSEAFQVTHEQHFEDNRGKVISVFFFLIQLDVETLDKVEEELNIPVGKYTRKGEKLTYRMDLESDSKEEAQRVATRFVERVNRILNEKAGEGI